MSEHENKRDSETARRVFQWTNHGLGDDLTRVANDERITEPNIEDYLRGEARVAASKNRGQRSLLHSEGGAVLDTLAGMLRGARHKTFVAATQLTPGFGGGVGPCRWLLAHGWGGFTLPWCGNCLGVWGLVFGAWGFGAWCLVLGVWCLVLGVWGLVFGAWGLGPGVLWRCFGVAIASGRLAQWPWQFLGTQSRSLCPGERRLLFRGWLRARIARCQRHGWSCDCYTRSM